MRILIGEEVKTLTDLEIEVMIGKKIGSIKNGKTMDYYDRYCPKYCSSWAAIGPIMQKHKIGFCFNDYASDHNLNCWEAATCHNYEVATHSTNPLRAACEVYLMIEVAA
jgi:hypothetical protein